MNLKTVFSKQSFSERFIRCQLGRTQWTRQGPMPVCRFSGPNAKKNPLFLCNVIYSVSKHLGFYNTKTKN